MGIEEYGNCKFQILECSEGFSWEIYDCEYTQFAEGWLIESNENFENKEEAHSAAIRFICQLEEGEI